MYMYSSKEETCAVMCGNRCYNHSEYMCCEGGSNSRIHYLVENPQDSNARPCSCNSRTGSMYNPHKEMCLHKQVTPRVDAIPPQCTQVLVEDWREPQWRQYLCRGRKLQFMGMFI